MVFDFSPEGGRAACQKLERILSSSPWSTGGLNWSDDYTLLLLDLINSGSIEVIERRFALRDDYSDEEQSRAKRLTQLMRKKKVNAFLLHFSSRFPRQENDSQKTMYNALFFPELMTYIRCGNLGAEKMFDMFMLEGCNTVTVAPEYQGSNSDGVAYSFVRAMRYVKLKASVDEIWDKRQRAISEVYLNLNF